jgi:hypothetical protein
MIKEVIILADMTFSSIEELMAAAQIAVNKGLKVEVAEVVKNVESQQIIDKVLNVYDPISYDRRTSGGIDDIQNINGNLIGDCLLEVTNNTPLNDAYGINRSGNTLNEIVLSGDGYMFDYDYAYNQPRDYVTATEEELESTQAHVIAMAESLKRQGFNVVVG